MARNVEIKARIESVDSLVPRVAALAGDGPFQIAQDDVFFHCDTGRLKLRMFSESSGELIFYRRRDSAGPKESFYIRSPAPDPASLRQSLGLAYGETGRVTKRRTLYLVGRTRVHLDRVEGLGDFIELEVVLDEGESIDSGTKEAQSLMAALGIGASQLIEGAYVDLFPRPL